MRARLASGNAHKLEELRRALPGWAIEILERTDYPPETGSTYEENARGKAVFGRSFAAPGEWVIGEDSGIEVDALGGRPGVESARWAHDGVACLLTELVGEVERGACYVCVIVAIGPNGEEVSARGTLEGSIGTSRRGTDGFGYDPVFIPVGEMLTVAELGNAWKQEHSHRARAAAAVELALS